MEASDKRCVGGGGRGGCCDGLEKKKMIILTELTVWKIVLRIVL